MVDKILSLSHVYT